MENYCSVFVVFAISILLFFDTLFIGLVPSALKNTVKSVYTFTRLPGRPLRRQNIAIVTRFTDDDFRQLTEPNMQQYCKKHGYDLIIVNDHPELIENNTFTPYTSIPFAVMKKVLSAPQCLEHRLYDWLFWTDQDSLFLNHNRALEDIVDDRYDVIVSTGLPDDHEFGQIADARHLLIKNGRNAHEVLADLIKLSSEHCGQFILDNPGAASTLNGWLHLCNADGTFWSGEAGMLLALYTFRPADYRCRFKKVHHRIMNSQFPAYEDGDLIVSFPDHMLEARKNLIKDFLKYTNFKYGKVDKSHTNRLDPVDPGIGDHKSLEELYELYLNVPCSADDDGVDGKGQ